VGFVPDKVVLGQVFSEYFGFPCQFSFHRLLDTHHLSSGAGTVDQLVPDVPSGLSLTPPQETKQKTEKLMLLPLHGLQYSANIISVCTGKPRILSDSLHCGDVEPNLQYLRNMSAPIDNSIIIMGRTWCSVRSATDGSTVIWGLKIQSLCTEHVDNQVNK
jgi:hypothetical protein